MAPYGHRSLQKGPRVLPELQDAEQDGQLQGLQADVRRRPQRRLRAPRDLHRPPLQVWVSLTMKGSRPILS